MKTFNNICHYILGISIMYFIGNATEFSTYTDYSKVIAIITSLFLGFGIGWSIEQFQFYITKVAKAYWNDVARTTVGFLIGGLMAVFFPNLNLFMWVSLSVTAILSAVELILLYKIYKQIK